jgi:hypothetical protein
MKSGFLANNFGPISATTTTKKEEEIDEQGQKTHCQKWPVEPGLVA